MPSETPFVGIQVSTQLRLNSAKDKASPPIEPSPKKRKDGKVKRASADMAQLMGDGSGGLRGSLREFYDAGRVKQWEDETSRSHEMRFHFSMAHVL
jgi:hypothetical protein